MFFQILLIYMRPSKRKILWGDDALFMDKGNQFILRVGPEIGTLKTPPKRMKRLIKNSEISVFRSEGSLSHNIFLR